MRRTRIWRSFAVLRCASATQDDGGVLSERTAMNDQTTKLVRTVGFWGLVAMCINAVVGSGVFLLPTESYKTLGPFSLGAPLIFAVPVFTLVLCFAEASSH